MKIITFAVAALLSAQLHLNAEVLENSTPSSADINSVEMSCNQNHRNRSSSSPTFNHISNFNNFFGQTVVPAGSTIPFNGTPVELGGIAQTSPDTFTFTSSGNYYVNFTASPFYFTTLGASVGFSVNGAPVQPGTSINFGDTPLVLQQIIPIIASPLLPATLQVVVSGSSITFPDGPGAQISIIQLSTLGNH